MSVTVDTSQLERLEHDLVAAGPKMVAASEVVLSAVARDVYNAARAAAPVLTGALQGSIYLHTDRGERTIGSPLDYGFYQEFGTSHHAPQPWLFPSSGSAGDKLARGLVDRADPV